MQKVTKKIKTWIFSLKKFTFH